MDKIRFLVVKIADLIIKGQVRFRYKYDITAIYTITSIQVGYEISRHNIVFLICIIPNVPLTSKGVYS